MNLLINSILWSISPLFELRAAIPLSVIYGGDFWILYVLLSILANISIIPFIFYFLDNMHGSFMKINIYKKIFNKTIFRIRKKIQKNIGTKKEFLALYLLIALPFPMTGVYTGTIAAWFFNLPRKSSLKYIIYGAITAGIIILISTLFLISLSKNTF